jgi:hypothetical protein
MEGMLELPARVDALYSQQLAVLPDPALLRAGFSDWLSTRPLPHCWAAPEGEAEALLLRQGHIMGLSEQDRC